MRNVVDFEGDPNRKMICDVCKASANMIPPPEGKKLWRIPLGWFSVGLQVASPGKKFLCIDQEACSVDCACKLTNRFKRKLLTMKSK